MLGFEAYWYTLQCGGGSIRLPKRPLRPLFVFLGKNFCLFLANSTRFPYHIIRKTTLQMRHHKNFLGKQNKTSASQIKFTNTKHVYANFQQDSFRNRQMRASYFWTLFLLHPVQIRYFFPILLRTHFAGMSKQLNS